MKSTMIRTAGIAVLSLITFSTAQVDAATHHHKFRTVQSLGIPPMIVNRSGEAWALTPQGWAIDASEQGGVDVYSFEKHIYAGSNILPINRSMQGYYGNEFGPPSQSMLTIMAIVLKGSGRNPNIHYTTPPQHFDGYYTQRGFATSQVAGKFFYHIYGDPDSQYIESYYVAMTDKADWTKYGRTATAVALSIHRSVHPVSTYTGGDDDNGSGGGDGNSEPDPMKGYNAILGMQYYHDPNTGQNYWVDPSTAVVDGPDGQGVYTKNGNDITKLVPGESD